MTHQTIFEFLSTIKMKMNTSLWLFFSVSTFFIFTPSHQSLVFPIVIFPRAPPQAHTSTPTPPPPPNAWPHEAPMYLNPRLKKAYIALQALKHAITADPKNFTSDWYGPHVCNYTGVYCAPALDNPKIQTVAGIDLNHADISGVLPDSLCLLTDLALFHINSNRFCGTLPESFTTLSLLYELDISNNLFSGKFPNVVLSLPSLKFLDIRFNKFTGNVPSKLYDLKLDALFINDNDFKITIPKNFGNSPVSVVVLANNKINGCFPASIAKMKKTLNELIISNSNLVGCLPPEIGSLQQLTVFDVSFNKLSGSLPETMGQMKSLEQLNVGHNNFSGDIPASICSLPKLENFTYSYNYFCNEPKVCLKLPEKDDRKNCLVERPLQRSVYECKAFYTHPVDCAASGCSSGSARSPPPAAPSAPAPSSR